MKNLIEKAYVEYIYKTAPFINAIHGNNELHPVTTATRKDFDALLTFLLQDAIPEREISLRVTFYMVAHPDIRESLENIEGFISTDKYPSCAKSGIIEDEIGCIGALRIIIKNYMAPFIDEFLDKKIPIYRCFIFGVYDEEKMPIFDHFLVFKMQKETP